MNEPKRDFIPAENQRKTRDRSVRPVMSKDEAPGTRPRVRARRTRFLASLRQTANVRAACEEAGISRKTAYQWRKKEEWFAKKWSEALDDFADLADLRAKQLAVEGILEPIYYAGALVGYQQVFDTKLLLRLLERAKPEQWGPPNLKVHVTRSSSALPEGPTQEKREALQKRVKMLIPLLSARYVAILAARQN